MKMRRPRSQTGQAKTEAEQKPLWSAAKGPPVSGSVPAMVTPDSAPTAKARGRLNRTVLAMLGKGLADCFDEIRQQEVPERLKSLLQQF